MHDGVTFGIGTTNNRRTGRGNKDCRVMVQTLFTAMKYREPWRAGKPVVVVVYTHADLDEQEYTEDGNRDHEDEDGHDDGVLEYVKLSCRIFDVRVLTNGDGGHE